MEEQIELNKRTEATTNPWDDVGGLYVKLEKDKAKFLLLINWKVQKVKKFKDDNGNLKEQMEFSADVLSEDGVPCQKVFSTTSINALLGLKEVFNPYFLTNNNSPKLIRIKKMGEGKSTIYDVEEQKLSTFNVAK